MATNMKTTLWAIGLLLVLALFVGVGVKFLPAGKTRTVVVGPGGIASDVYACNGDKIRWHKSNSTPMYDINFTSTVPISSPPFKTDDVKHDVIAACPGPGVCDHDYTIAPHVADPIVHIVPNGQDQGGISCR